MELGSEWCSMCSVGIQHYTCTLILEILDLLVFELKFINMVVP